MGKYLNPKADLTFKKIFGEHPHLVISLLNALLPLQDGERVERIEYWPAEKIPRRTEAEKDSIVDVCCRDNKKREFIVEMQMTWTESFKKRVLLNASKAYVAQTEAGEPYEHHDYRTNCEKLSTSMLSWSVSCKPPCRLAIRQRVFLYLCTS